MNILVLDVAASESGALSILKQKYNDFQSDTQNQYILCVSTPKFESRGNVTVLSFPWVKRTWFNRLWFECVWVAKLVRKYSVDRIFSIQNLIIGNYRCEKWIYLHTSIPFADIRFSIIKEPKMWVYQHIIGGLIKSSSRKADKVIVQTEWMRDASIKQAGLRHSIVDVERPPISTEAIVICSSRESVKNSLFYPATAFKYKNHMLVLSALNALKEAGKLGELTLTLTLTGRENKLAERIFQYAKEHQLPVDFRGPLPYTEVMQKYAHSTLIFPSYIETFGLPILEARLSNTLILASDCSFSREILNGYNGAYFFDPFDAESCASCILKTLASVSIAGSVAETDGIQVQTDNNCDVILER